MAKINIQVTGKPIEFAYSISKREGVNKKEQWWDFTVSHESEDIPHIEKSFSFKQDTFNNATTGTQSHHQEEIAMKILEKEGL